MGILTEETKRITREINRMVSAEIARSRSLDLADLKQVLEHHLAYIVTGSRDHLTHARRLTLQADLETDYASALVSALELHVAGRKQRNIYLIRASHAAMRRVVTRQPEADAERLLEEEDGN